MYKRTSIVLLLVFSLVFFGCISQTTKACTAEAKLCPDGSAVGRTGPNCEFAACPVVNLTVIFAKAEVLFSNFSFNKSYELYSQARIEYLKVNDSKGARNSLDKMQSINRILLELPITDEKQLLDDIYVAFPNATQEQIGLWLSAQYLVIDGVPHYFSSVRDNILFRNPSMKRKLLQESNKSNVMMALFDSVISSQNSTGDSPYVRPVNYSGVEMLYVPRTELPQNGLLKLWMPVPIETDSQKDVEVISITPAKYLVGVPTIKGDIGLAYFEVPLETLKEDLNITILFSYTSYEQHFVVDTNKVGEYDKESALYEKYTVSAGNTQVTPTVKQLALNAIGNETNPYLQAEKLYWFVINTTTYNFVQHITLSELNIPESEFARINGIGDCGTQSMYFTALARSIGIPARSSGGYQLFGGGTGSHFWAEFYLPNYGWVPVDVTAAEAADWVYEESDARNVELKKFFFGNLDVTRFVIQNDVDVQPAPPYNGKVFLPMVRQGPAAVLDNDEEDIGITILQGFSMKVSST